jgi:hypothetical protein
MAFGDQQSRAECSWRLLLAILCVLLVMVSGTLQVAHAHADGADTHANCSLCAAAHITVQVAQTPAPVQAAPMIGVLHVLPAPVLASGVCVYALFTRPPPSV